MIRPRYSFALPARTDAVAHARRLVRERLQRWYVAEETCDTAALVISELVTNAVVHTANLDTGTGAGPGTGTGMHSVRRIACELHEMGDQLRIAVRDQGVRVGVPRVRHGSPESAESGRGLLLVDAVSSAWGTYEAEPGPGRVVWAELPHRMGAPG